MTSATTPAAPVADTPTVPMAETFADKLAAAGITSAVHRATKDDIATATVALGEFFAAAKTLRDSFDYIRFIDISVIDLVETGREDRFMVYLLVYSMEEKKHARIQTTTVEKIASITPLFAGAHNYEREAFDLFGVVFDGHPSLTRIMMPDGWVGHPMRRDSVMPVEQVDFTVTRALYNT
jgi:NADH-quinone oxidoreductase subunit C